MTLRYLVFYFRSTTSHESGIAWLEKELHSLQREKQKLEREKEKYLDREQRLEKIRTAMRNQQQKEITVKTSNGEEFKFGGISENFTRKLFEWEERRNIAPESSTIGETHSMARANLNKSEKVLPQHQSTYPRGPESASIEISLSDPNLLSKCTSKC